MSGEVGSKLATCLDMLELFGKSSLVAAQNKSDIDTCGGYPGLKRDGHTQAIYSNLPSLKKEEFDLYICEPFDFGDV